MLDDNDHPGAEHMAIIKLRDFYPHPGAAAGMVRDWQQKVLDSDLIVLDLSEQASGVVNPSAVRLDAIQLLLLSNLLAGARASVELDVVLPDSATITRAIARTPLWATVANHRGLQHMDGLRSWTGAWNPHDRDQLSEMLQVSPESMGPCQDSLLTLINPHCRPVSTLARDVRGIVDPWLNRRFIPAGRNSDQDAALRAIERVMTELAENVGDHAYGEAVSRSTQSICQLFTTRGGGERSMNRFVITTMDNGIGIPRSVRRRRSDLNGESALRFALAGKLTHDADRKWGLSNVRNIVAANPGSKFQLLTSHREDRGHALLCTVVGDTVDIVEWRWMPIVGTIAYAQLALPVPTVDQPSLFDDHGLESSRPGPGELVSA